MPSLQIREMPEELYQLLKSSAERDHRSLAQQALKLLASALQFDGSRRSRRIEALENIRTSKMEIKSKKIDIAALVRKDRSR